MPDEAPTLQLANTAGQPESGPLSPERVERILANFRDWLQEIPAAAVAPAPANGSSIDLHSLVSGFIALRQEVNLQTKSTRTSVEQGAATLQQLEVALEELRDRPEPETPDADDVLKPLLKAVVDVYDALALASRQVERQKDKIAAGLETVLESIAIEQPPKVESSHVESRPGFWKRLFGATDASASGMAMYKWREDTLKNLKNREQRIRDSANFLRQAVDGLLTGYTMSLNRIDRILPQFGVDAIPCLGERFDPELMEVVEVVADSGRPSGEVIEEVRRGYYWKDSVFRYAQVRVAK